MKTVFSYIKRNSGLMIIFTSFVIVIFSGLKSGILPQALDSIRKADPFHILLALLCSVGHILISAFANRSFIRKQGYDVSLKDAFYSAVAGSYYSSITPAGTGGFPVQIYYLGKCGVPVGVASSAVICFLNSWFIIRLLLLSVFIFMRKQLLTDVLGNNMIFLIIGCLYNIYLITLFMVLGFVRKPIRFLIGLIDKAIRRFRLSRNPDSIRDKLTDTADRYHEAMQKTLLHPSEIFRQFTYGLFFVILMNSIIYFACRSLGLYTSSYFDLLGMSLCQNIASAYMPTPGGAGAQELIFSLFFSSLIAKEHLLAVMLIWRFSGFYFNLFLGAIITGIGSIKEKS